MAVAQHSFLHLTRKNFFFPITRSPCLRSIHHSRIYASNNHSMSAATTTKARVAVAQMTSTNDLDANFNTCSRLAEEAAAAGAKLLCFPENFSFVGAKDGESLTIAEELDGPVMRRYCDLARKWRMWFSLGGFQERGQDDAHLCNTHVLVDDSGNIRSTYRKIHLFDVDVPGNMTFKESSFTTAGKLKMLVYL